MIVRDCTLSIELIKKQVNRNSLEKIHNKGIIVDGSRVLVSSINWNFNSPNFNREAGVIITDPETASYFLSVFEDDWNAASVRSQADSPDYRKPAIAVAVIAFLVCLYIYRRR